MIYEVVVCAKLVEVGDNEIHVAYEKLCDEGILKDQFKTIDRKGLIHALDFPRNFKIERIKDMLRKNHDMDEDTWEERNIIDDTNVNP